MAMSKKLVVITGAVLVSGGALVLALRSAPSTRSSREGSQAARVTADAHDAEHVRPSAELAASVAKARAELEPQARRNGLVSALADAAEREAAGAARLALSLSLAEGRDEALRETVGHYLSVDPEGARAWLNELVAREDAELNLVLASAAARYDAELGVELARRVHENLRAPLLEEIFANWAGSDPKGAAEAAAALENPKDRRAAGAGTASIWAQTEPQEAWAWAGGLEPENVRRPVLESLVSAWSERDPAAAARAAIEAQSSSRQRLLDTAFSAWAMRDLDAAFTWLESVPDPQARDGAATAALLQLLQTKPKEAAERAASWAQNEANDPSSGVLDKVLSALDASTAQRTQRTQGAR